MKKHLLPLAFLLLLAVLILGTFVKQPPVFDERMLSDLGHPTRMVSNLERYFEENLLGLRSLRSLYISLRTAAGYCEKDGLYLCDDSLVASFVPSEDATVHKGNTQAIIDFAGLVQLPTAVMLLPTASAIYQDRLPPYAAEVQYNQHGFIQLTNEAFAGKLAAIDVYPTLFAARKEPLYYRTDGDLTSRGSYLAYTALIRRLGFNPYGETAFHQQFSSLPYYGRLYDQWGYGGISADTVSAYLPLTTSPVVRVDHWLRFEQKTYHTLYPDQATFGGNPRDLILGGHSPRITIRNYSAPEATGKLLVLGDSNALGILPFLALHYSQITYADPSLLTASELAAILPTDHDQLVFIFSLESYMNSAQPSRATQLGM